MITKSYLIVRTGTQYAAYDPIEGKIHLQECNLTDAFQFADTASGEQQAEAEIRRLAQYYAVPTDMFVLAHVQVQIVRQVAIHPWFPGEVSQDKFLYLTR